MENKLNDLLNFNIICRICLKNKQIMVSIFEKGSTDELKSFREMLEECASVHISTDDSLPNNLCIQCSQYLEQSYKLRVQCLSSEKLLQQLIGNSQMYIKTEKHSLFDDNNGLNNNGSILSLCESQDNILSTKDIEVETVKEELVEDFVLNDHNLDINHSEVQINKYECENCSIQFLSKIEFNKHNSDIHTKKLIKCLFCKNMFSTARALKQHCRAKIRCEICNKDYGCRRSLRQHRKEHSSQLMFQCEECGKHFSKRSQLRRHKQIHGIKRNLCTFCGKAFSDKANLNVHIRIHTGEKRYQCKICDTRFKDSGCLQSHLISHTTEKKYECEICRNTYKWRSQLKQHKLTHTDEVNFVCDICEKRFKTQDNLRGHKRIHTGVRNHICSYCSKAFYKTNHLKTHLRTHTGEKPFVCNKCGRGFSAKHVLIGHMKTHTQLPN